MSQDDDDDNRLFMRQFKPINRAIMDREEAKMHRARALITTDPQEREEAERTAAVYQDRALAILGSPVEIVEGCAGEVVTREDAAKDPRTYDTVTTVPAVLRAEASASRLFALRELDIMAEALDLAEDTKKSPAERMLAYQATAANKLALRFLVTAEKELHAFSRSDGGRPERSIEAARLANVGARLMSATAEAISALDRLKNGRTQTVIIQRVKVTKGGQAVIQGAGSRPNRPRGRKAK